MDGWLRILGLGGYFLNPKDFNKVKLEEFARITLPYDSLFYTDKTCFEKPERYGFDASHKVPSKVYRFFLMHSGLKLYRDGDDVWEYDKVMDNSEGVNHSYDLNKNAHAPIMNHLKNHLDTLEAKLGRELDFKELYPIGWIKKENGYVLTDTPPYSHFPLAVLVNKNNNAFSANISLMRPAFMNKSIDAVWEFGAVAKIKFSGVQ